MWYSEKIKVKLPQALENGVKIIVNQHSGNYGNEKAWPMCRQAKPFFNNMKKAGILWEKGYQAAQKVNEI